MLPSREMPATYGRRSLVGTLLVYVALVVLAVGLSRAAACVRADAPALRPR